MTDTRVPVTSGDDARADFGCHGVPERSTIRGVRFAVLGPLEVAGDNGPVALGGPKQRRLMAALISQFGSSVSTDALVDAVWGDPAPRSAAKTLQGYVFHLRQAIAATAQPSSPWPVIVTTPVGYRLDANADDVDAARFTTLVGKARQSTVVRDWGTARTCVDDALSLWRGAAYAEFRDSDFAAAESARLEQLKLVARETGFEIDLARGEDAALVPELEKALAELPTRERLWELLIRALYCAGRQSDALLAYVRARQLLASELGVEPGAGLRSVQAAVLAQDPRLDHPAATPRAMSGLSSRHPTTGAYAFEGRESDLRWLRAQWRRTIDGGGRVAVLSGGPGLGKTRLLAAFADEVQRSGSLVVRRTGLTAPDPTTISALASGGPALVALDSPVTGFDPQSLDSLPVLIAIAIDPAEAPAHVRASLATADWRELGPLTCDDCSRIGRRWLGAELGEAKVAAIMRATAGVPARLHEFLARALEERTRREIDSSAGELRSARAEVLARRAELARGVRSLRRGRSLYVSMPGTPSAASVRAECPYRGLESYSAEDAALFHGRDAVVEQLVARVADTPLVAVVGASGSGKTSVVQAGLMVALAHGCLPGSGSWQQFLTTPAEDPPAPKAPAIVVIDQFEQAWVVHRSEESRRRYLDAVLALTDAGHRLVLTLRADHVERASQHSRLREALTDGSVLLGPMTPAELVEVVTGPADVAGFDVEGGLTDVILEDVRGLAAPLPLLSTALMETWEACAGSTLTVGAYAAAGGVAGSLARRADAVLAAMDAEERAAARVVLLRLAEGDAGKLVRRRCPYPEAAHDETARRALDALAAARLITVDATTVEVTHEALFESWPRLAEWLQADERGRRLRAHLAPAAHDWDETGRLDSDLYGGVRLDAALEWAGDHPSDTTPLERAFLDASTMRADAALRAERARTRREAVGLRRLRLLLSAVATAAAVALAASVIALGQRHAATEQARLAVARQLGTAALVNQPLDRSLLLAVSALRMDNNATTRGDLLAALQGRSAAVGIWTAGGDPLWHVTLTGDNEVAVVTGLGGLSSWRLAERGKPTPLEQVDGVAQQLPAARPGTNEVAIANGEANADANPIRLWDFGRHRGLRLSLTGAQSEITSLAWSSDGRWLAAGLFGADVLVWDVDHPDQPAIHIRRLDPVPAGSVTGTPARFPAVVYAGRGDFAVVEASGKVLVQQVDSARPTRMFDIGAQASAVASQPRGASLAIGYTDGRVALFPLAAGRPSRSLAANTSTVTAITVSGDGQLLASIGADGVVNLSDLRTGQLLARLGGHTAPVTDAAFTAERRRLYTSSLDGTVIGWDTVNLSNLGTELRPAGSATAGAHTNWVAVGRHGEIAEEYADGTARIWGSDNKPERPIRVTNGSLTGGAFSPDGRLLVTTEDSGVVRVVDARAGRAVEIMDRLPDRAVAAAYSPNGRRIAVLDATEAFVYNAVTRRQTGGPFAALGDSRQIAWSPDSRTFAVGGGPNYQGSLSVLDARAGDEVWGSVGGSVVAWSPDGRIVASAGEPLAGVQLRRAADGEAVGGGWKDHALTLYVAFSPDGSVLASAGTDGAVVLRDVATGEPLGSPLVANSNAATFVAFDDSGQMIVATADGGLWRWDIAVESMLSRACAIAGRNLTHREWADLHTGRPYITACP